MLPSFEGQPCPIGGDTGSCRATEPLEMLPAMLLQLWSFAPEAWPLAEAEEHGWRSCAFSWSTCSSTSRQPERKRCQDASPALPRPLAVFGGSSSNWRWRHTKERNTVLFCQTRLNGAKGEENPMHKQHCGSVTATPPPDSNLGCTALVDALTEMHSSVVFLRWLPGYSEGLLSKNS